MLVRTVRNKVIMLRNDLKAKNGELESALAALHALGPVAGNPVPRARPAGSDSQPPTSADSSAFDAALDGSVPFAIVDDVTPGSPAAEAGIQVSLCEDYV